MRKTISKHTQIQATQPRNMQIQSFMKKYGKKMDSIVERICWETRATFEGASGMPMEIPNPVERFISFNRPIEKEVIDFAASIGVTVSNVPESDGTISGYVKFEIPMKVLRHGVIPPLRAEQDMEKLLNKLGHITEEYEIQDAYDRKNNLGAYSGEYEQ